MRINSTSSKCQNYRVAKRTATPTRKPSHELRRLWTPGSMGTGWQAIPFPSPISILRRPRDCRAHGGHNCVVCFCCKTCEKCSRPQTLALCPMLPTPDRIAISNADQRRQSAVDIVGRALQGELVRVHRSAPWRVAREWLLQCCPWRRCNAMVMTNI